MKSARCICWTDIEYDYMGHSLEESCFVRVDSHNVDNRTGIKID
jgi:hypothetical protein